LWKNFCVITDHYIVSGINKRTQENLLSNGGGFGKINGFPVFLSTAGWPFSGRRPTAWQKPNKHLERG
jgi:hypothetical protein